MNILNIDFLWIYYSRTIKGTSNFCPEIIKKLKTFKNNYTLRPQPAKQSTICLSYKTSSLACTFQKFSTDPRKITFFHAPLHPRSYFFCYPTTPNPMLCLPPPPFPRPGEPPPPAFFKNTLDKRQFLMQLKLKPLYRTDLNQKYPQGEIHFIKIHNNKLSSWGGPEKITST